MKKRTEAVDIIIPVYNGYDDLQLCMPSVLKHTDLTKHRLILINDCSPDERIAPYLDSFAGEHILVLHNEKNLGFSANVNKGTVRGSRCPSFKFRYDRYCRVAGQDHRLCIPGGEHRNGDTALKQCYFMFGSGHVPGQSDAGKCHGR